MSDLRPEVGERDHIRGSAGASVTLVAYGDYECPYTRRAERAVGDLLAERPDSLRYVYRHFPLGRIHPHADRAAEAAEEAAAQGRFWELHDLLFAHQQELDDEGLRRLAAEAGLDLDRFDDALASGAHLDRVAADKRSGAGSGVQGTPTFFLNGRRREEPYDLEGLRYDVDVAGAS